MLGDVTSRDMVCHSTTLFPSAPRFPLFLRPLPLPYPTPLPPRKQGNGLIDPPTGWRERRDWAREIEELSDEEAELEDMANEVQQRGHSFLIPIGRTVTEQEEKTDAEGASSDEEEQDNEMHQENAEAEAEDGEIEEGGREVDLDADMEDLDEQDPSSSDEQDAEDLDEVDQSNTGMNTSDFYDEDTPAEIYTRNTNLHRTG